MYRSFTVADWRKHIKLATDYSVDGFLIFGTHRRYPYQMLRESLQALDINASYSKFEDEFLEPIQTFTFNGKHYWFVVAYGGALLSEYLHLACIFGSQKNILLGSCGGLQIGAKSNELIVPDWSYADESSAKAYQPRANNRYPADKILSDRLATKLAQNYTVYRGSTITYQAMLSETWDDVTAWAKQGYSGVEMEAATVFAVSKHFNVPSAAILRIGDNLIEEETVLDINYENAQTLHTKVSRETLSVALEELLAF
jgi:purine-nucleoside phosphorylase